MTTLNSNGLTPISAAQARHYSYQLFSRLYLAGITDETWPMVQAVPGLARALPEPFILDEAAAVHYQLFGLNVFPYEAIFLDDSGLLGGPITESVAHSYYRFGYMNAAATDNLDHVGQELAAMAFLCQAEAEALARGENKTAVSWQYHQITFLQHHLLRWLVPFVQAVQAQDSSFYTAVSQLTLTIIYDHYEHLAATTKQLPKEWALPAPPMLLDNEKTGLKEIAHYLMTPAYSGIFWGRDDVSRLARQLNLPRGFGDRQQLLTNLMRTAVQYEQFAALLRALETAVKMQQDTYQAQAEAMPLWQPFLLPWQEKVTQAGTLLTRMEQKI